MLLIATHLVINQALAGLQAKEDLVLNMGAVTVDTGGTYQAGKAIKIKAGISITHTQTTCKALTTIELDAKDAIKCQKSLYKATAITLIAPIIEAEESKFMSKTSINGSLLAKNSLFGETKVQGSIQASESFFKSITIEAGSDHPSITLTDKTHVEGSITFEGKPGMVVTTPDVILGTIVNGQQVPLSR